MNNNARDAFALQANCVKLFRQRETHAKKENTQLDNSHLNDTESLTIQIYNTGRANKRREREKEREWKSNHKHVFRNEKKEKERERKRGRETCNYTLGESVRQIKHYSLLQTRVQLSLSLSLSNVCDSALFVRLCKSLSKSR